MTLAPEHEMVKSITTPEQEKEVEDYIAKVSTKSERERQAEVKNISGVFTGGYAIHPFTKVKIPIWIGDYVLASYGTGAVMAVPSGDQRDFLILHDTLNFKSLIFFDGIDVSKKAFVEKGNTKLTHSSFLNGMNYKEAIQKIILELEENNYGRGAVNFKLRDAIFSRQRYWGEPIPIYFKSEVPYPISEKNLPLELPEVEKYLPTPDGKPPLGNAKNWAWDEVNEKVVPINKIDPKLFSLLN